VLFAEIEPADAELSAERIRRALHERAPSSIGLATFPADGTDLEDLTRQADSRLYASRRGRSELHTAPAREWSSLTAALAGASAPVASRSSQR
jgi:GGDEF domain-containing protein